MDSATRMPIRDAELLRKSQNYFENSDNNAMPWYTGRNGEFWRPLLPGKYMLEVLQTPIKE